MIAKDLVFVFFTVLFVCNASAWLTFTTIGFMITKVLVENNGTLDIASDMKMPKDRFSIVDAIKHENPSHIKTMHSDFGKDIICNSQDKKEDEQNMKIRIKDAIRNSLNFYASHLDVINSADHTVGLAVLKAVDRKYGSEFLSAYPVDEWMSKICTQAEGPSDYSENCLVFSDPFLSRDEHWGNWSNAEILGNMEPFPNIGTDKETIWSELNYQCLTSLLVRCEVPHVCERVMFDPLPGTQYMLTHQLVHRIFAQTKMETCGLSKSLIDDNVNQRLCGKMLQEANLIADNGAPFIFRDLFAEQMMFCGFIGYPNFFREHWLNMLLSWQSKSDYGCFLRVDGSNFETTDMNVQRLVTEKEGKMGVKSTGENCQLHFTSIGLSALAVAWDYLEENCN